ncbi:diguanylate cyclase (GGDEF)-like protein/PAS domain S-box-containing protein [Amorphus suaedae]
MNGLHFLSDDIDSSGALAGVYSPELVLASVLISMVAAFVAFNHVRLIRAAGAQGVGVAWNAVAAVTLGIGIWAMHFVGMLAFTLPVLVSFRIDRTVLSLVPAIVASVIAMKVMAAERPSVGLLVFGGVSMGIGICLMHYIGMAAMVAPVDMYYVPSLLVASVVIATVLATLSLFLCASIERTALWPTGVMLFGSFIMGGAVSSMHYVAMQATVYLPAKAYAPMAGWPRVSVSTLAWSTVSAVLLIFVMAAASAYLRRREIRALSAADASGLQADLLYDQLKTVASRVPGMVYQFRRTPDGRYSFPYASEKIYEIYRVTPDEVVDDAGPLVGVLHPDDRDRVLEEIEESAKSLTIWRSRYRLRFPDGAERWLLGNAAPRREDDGTVNWSGFIMDVTAQQEAEQTIQRLAYYDSLTGLPNRTMLYERLDHGIARLARSGEYGALFFIDIDRFKFLNEQLGHSTGDRLLQLVAERLTRMARRDDITARLAGDEFVFAIEGIGDDRDLAAAEAEKTGIALLAAVADSGAQFHGLGQPPTGSVGISLYGGPRQLSRDEVVKRAEIAKSAAKEHGGNAMRFFDREMSAAVTARATLERDLRAALCNDEMVLYYQRQVNRHGENVGVEALARWQHPKQGLLAPDRFIPLAEQIGVIAPLGSWALKTACAQLIDWRASPAMGNVSIAVNVSPRQFYRDDFVAEVADALDQSAVDPRLLKLEITESLLLHDLEDARTKVQLLREIGVRTSIDDFGTGYSSLSYLAHLDVAELKIDRTFIWDLSSPRNDKARMIVDAIANLGMRMGLTVCAEGVETEEQFELLKQTGCQHFQGYLFGRPAPAGVLREATHA